MVVLAPWRSDEDAPFDGLPDERNLERVLITGLQAAHQQHPDLLAWTQKATTELLALVRGHGWKRAFRLWNAALFPDSEAFVDRMLQEHSTKEHCLQALRATLAYGALEALLEFPGRP